MRHMQTRDERKALTQRSAHNLPVEDNLFNYRLRSIQVHQRNLYAFNILILSTSERKERTPIVMSFTEKRGKIVDFMRDQMASER